MSLRSVSRVMTMAACALVTLSCGASDPRTPFAPALSCSRSTIFFGRGEVPAGTTVNQTVSVPAAGRIAIEDRAPSTRELASRITVWPCFEGSGVGDRCRPIAEGRAQSATVSVVSPTVSSGLYVVGVTHNGSPAELAIEVQWVVGVCE